MILTNVSGEVLFVPTITKVGATFAIGASLTVGDELRVDPVVSALIAAGDLSVTGYSSDPGSPATQEEVSLAFADGEMSGLQLALDAGDPTHDILIGVGVCMGGSPAKPLRLASALVKRIDATWAAGTAAGGLRPGPPPATVSAWYFVWLLENTTTGVLDAMFDASSTGANAPAGWAARRILGVVRTDGASLIVPFTQRGGVVKWKTPILDFTTGASSTSQVVVPLTVPALPKVEALLQVVVDAESVYIHSVDEVDVAPSATLAPLASAGASAGIATGQVVASAIGGAVAMRALVGARSVHIATLGWTWDRSVV